MAAENVSSTSPFESLVRFPYRREQWEPIVELSRNFRRGKNEQFKQTTRDSRIKCLELFLRQFPFLPVYANGIEKCLVKDRNPFPKLEYDGPGFLEHDILFWIAFLQTELTKCEDIRALTSILEEARLKIGMSFYSSPFYELFFSFLSQNSAQIKDHDKKIKLLAHQFGYVPTHGQLDLHFPSTSTMTGYRCPIITMSYKNNVLHNVMSALIYPFERELTALHGKKADSQIADLWIRYTDSVSNFAPQALVIQLFERAMLATNFDEKVVFSYSDFLLNNRLLNKLKYLWRRALLVHASKADIFLLRLVELEIFENNALRARDYVAQMWCCNTTIESSLSNTLIALEEIF